MINKILSSDHLNALPDVEILVKGYYSLNGDSGRACSTITLVRHRDFRVIVDPGTLANPEILIRELKKRKIAAHDIHIVFLTHSHLDHIKNMGLFQRAEILDYWGWWSGDSWRKSTGCINDHIRVIETPGHSYDSITLSVKTSRGIIAICGDVFWDKNFPLHPRDDPYAADVVLLGKSRKKVLAAADYIIPGHGDIFKVSEFF